MDFLTDIDTSVLDSMTAQFSSVATTVSTVADKAAEKGKACLESVKETQDQAATAYSHVYKFLQQAENGGAQWKPERTGLILTEAPPGKGRSMWVSPQAVAKFQAEGSAALKKVEQH